jgi:hypothetical protein
VGDFLWPPNLEGGSGRQPDRLWWWDVGVTMGGGGATRRGGGGRWLGQVFGRGVTVTSLVKLD